MPSFSFNPGSQRYQWSSGDKKGQFVSKADLDGLMDGYNDQQADAIQAITKRMLNKRIGVNNWILEMAGALKPAHINAYTIGIGGKEQLNSSEYGKIGAILKEEYQYLRQFGRDILDQKLTRKQIEARANLYAESLYRSFEKGRESGHRANGYNWERRIRNAADSCDDCIGYAAQGWGTIGQFPTPGEQCQCKRNCRCTKEYSGSTVKPVENILTLKNGWIGMNTATIADSVIDSIAEEVLAQVKGLTLEQIKSKLSSAQPEQIEQLRSAIDGKDDDEMGDDDAMESAMAEGIDRVEFAHGMYMGKPTEADSTLIQEMTGYPSSPDDWFIFAACISDNLLQLSWPMAWHLNILAGIAQQLPGEVLLKDHRSTVDASMGFWLRTLTTRDGSPDDDELDTFGNLDLNRQRIADTGLVKVYAIGALHKSNEDAIEAVKTRRYQDLSTGSFLKGIRHICPVCSERYGMEVEAYDKFEDGSAMCPHTIPTPMMQMLASWGWLDEDTVFMPYAIVDAESQYHDETSFVYCGNLHQAQIVRS
jgi:hypothetical protein